MAFESQAMKQKKFGGVFGDVYGATTMLLPKEIELEKPTHSQTFELRFQAPDFGRAFRVSHSNGFDEIFVCCVFILIYCWSVWFSE